MYFVMECHKNMMFRKIGEKWWSMRSELEKYENVPKIGYKLVPSRKILYSAFFSLYKYFHLYEHYFWLKIFDLESQPLPLLFGTPQRAKNSSLHIDQSHSWLWEILIFLIWFTQFLLTNLWTVRANFLKKWLFLLLRSLWGCPHRMPGTMDRSQWQR